MKTNPWTIFLDLEETLIESWSDHTWLTHKAEAIGTFIKRSLIQSAHQSKSIYHDTPRLELPRFGLMSWAVWNDADKQIFQQQLQHWIEGNLKMAFSEDLIWTMEDWAALVLKNTGLRMSQQDLFDFCNKETVLFWLRNAEHGFPHGEITLIDDAVPHNNVVTSQTRKITTVNVDKLVAG